MGKTFITCPKDPKMQYYREVCAETFRKGNMRNWCKNCEVFQDQKKTTGESQQPQPYLNLDRAISYTILNDLLRIKISAYLFAKNDSTQA